MTTEPDETVDNPEIEGAPETEGAPPVERAPIVDDLSNISSIDDVRDVVNDGIDRLKEAGTEPFREAVRQLANKGLAGWRKLLDGVEGKS